MSKTLMTNAELEVIICEQWIEELDPECLEMRTLGKSMMLDVAKSVWGEIKQLGDVSAHLEWWQAVSMVASKNVTKGPLNSSAGFHVLVGDIAYRKLLKKLQAAKVDVTGGWTSFLALKELIERRMEQAL
jgi:hypothetical protein